MASAMQFSPLKYETFLFSFACLGFADTRVQPSLTNSWHRYPCRWLLPSTNTLFRAYFSLLSFTNMSLSSSSCYICFFTCLSSDVLHVAVLDQVSIPIFHCPYISTLTPMVLIILNLGNSDNYF